MPRVIGAELPAENMMQGYSSGENIRLNRERLKLQQMEAAENASAQRRQLQLQAQRTRVEANRLRLQAEDNARQAQLAAEEIRAKTELAEARAAEQARQFNTREERMGAQMEQKGTLAAERNQTTRDVAAGRDQTQRDIADLRAKVQQDIAGAKLSQADVHFKNREARLSAEAKDRSELLHRVADHRMTGEDFDRKVRLADMEARGTIRKDGNNYVANPNYNAEKEGRAALKRVGALRSQLGSTVLKIAKLQARSESAHEVLAAQGNNLSSSELVKYAQIRGEANAEATSLLQVASALAEEMARAGVPRDAIELYLRPILPSAPGLMDKVPQDQPQQTPAVAPAPAPASPTAAPMPEDEFPATQQDVDAWIQELGDPGWKTKGSEGYA